jgi:hypothetical protein
VRSFFGGINFLIAQFVEQCNPTFTWDDGPLRNESILPGLAPRKASSTFYQGAQLKEEQLSFVYVSVPQIGRLTMRRPVSVKPFLSCTTHGEYSTKNSVVTTLKVESAAWYGVSNWIPLHGQTAQEA